MEAIARSYGGGGHKNAAGFEAEGDLRELSDALVEKLEAALA